MFKKTFTLSAASAIMMLNFIITYSSRLVMHLLCLWNSLITNLC